MYKIDGWCVVYETLDELLEANVLRMEEYDGNYYVHLITEDPYYNTVWVVNQKTGKVSSMMYTQYIFKGIDTKAKTIDPKTLRRGA